MVIRFFAKNVLLIPSAKRKSHTEGVFWLLPCVCTVACSYALITWWSPRDSRTSCGSKPCCRRQPRCGTCHTFAYLMYQEDVIDQDDQIEWFPAALIQHSKREVGIGLVPPSNASSETVFNTPVGTPQNIGDSTSISFCSWIIHLGQKQSETFKKLMFWAQRSAWETFA